MDKVKLHQQDIQDIYYFIDHVQDEKTLCSIIEQLGYKIGVNVVTQITHMKKDIIIGKRQELRIQLTDVQNNFPLVCCAIIE